MAGKSKGSRRIWRDKDDAPELTAKWVAEADLYRGKKLVRRGRPPGTSTKTQTTVRISNDVLLYFRATGAGWQTRIDDALRSYVSSQRRSGS
jgi:uncharacterized protein (DUF4415 family)